MCLAYKVKDGKRWNPLRSYPPNEPCFCGSDKKSKKCCLPKVPLTCDEKDYENLRKIIRHLDAGGKVRVRSAAA